MQILTIFFRRIPPPGSLGSRSPGALGDTFTEKAKEAPGKPPPPKRANDANTLRNEATSLPPPNLGRPGLSVVDHAVICHAFRGRCVTRSSCSSRTKSLQCTLDASSRSRTSLAASKAHAPAFASRHVATSASE